MYVFNVMQGLQCLQQQWATHAMA